MFPWQFDFLGLLQSKNYLLKIVKWITHLEIPQPKLPYIARAGISTKDIFLTYGADEKKHLAVYLLNIALHTYIPTLIPTYFNFILHLIKMLS